MHHIRAKDSQGLAVIRPIVALSMIVLVHPSIARLKAESPRFHEGQFHGRAAYFLENERMRVAALRGAGHIAEIRLKSEDPRSSVNPLRVPHFKTIEPWQYDPKIHDSVYGGGTNRLLQSGYMGHLLNFPRFGAPSADEARNGLGHHGEALMVEWTKDRAVQSDESVTLTYSAHLPKTQYNVGRKLTLPADESVLYIEEWVENLTDYDRPAHWVQHVTFGPPFVEPGKTFLDMSATKGRVRGGQGNSLSPGDVQWPSGTAFDDQPAGLRVMQERPEAGTYVGFLMNPEREYSFFTMYHQDHNVLIGYVWRTSDYPWIGDWQENRRSKQLPWDGKVQARGMEFGTTPFGGPMQKVIENGPLFGVPTVRWIGGRQRLTVRYIAFVTPIPSGFDGVDDIQVGDDAIEITHSVSGRITPLKSAIRW